MALSRAGRITTPIITLTMVAIGDLDGDSDLDLAVTNINSRNVSILINAGCVLDTKFEETTIINGLPYYTDLIYQITSVPPVYAGMDAILTPNDDRNLTDAYDYLTFKMPYDGTVYVAFDSRANSLPDWMNGFSDTGDVIKTSLSTQPFLKIYRKALRKRIASTLVPTKRLGLAVIRSAITLSFIAPVAGRVPVVWIPSL